MQGTTPLIHASQRGECGGGGVAVGGDKDAMAAARRPNATYVAGPDTHQGRRSEHTTRWAGAAGPPVRVAKFNGARSGAELAGAGPEFAQLRDLGQATRPRRLSLLVRRMGRRELPRDRAAGPSRARGAPAPATLSNWLLRIVGAPRAGRWPPGRPLAAGLPRAPPPPPAPTHPAHLGRGGPGMCS